MEYHHGSRILLEISFTCTLDNDMGIRNKVAVNTRSSLLCSFPDSPRHSIPVNPISTNLLGL